MLNLLLAIRIAEKLNKSQMKVLAYFVEHGAFEGSYYELAKAIYDSREQYSNVRKYVKQLAELRLLAVDSNFECCRSDTNRTYIALTENWRQILEGE